MYFANFATQESIIRQENDRSATTNGGNIAIEGIDTEAGTIRVLQGLEQRGVAFVTAVRLCGIVRVLHISFYVLSTQRPANDSLLWEFSGKHERWVHANHLKDRFHIQGSP